MSAINFSSILVAVFSFALWAGAVEPAGAGRVNVIELDDQVISPVTEQYITQALGRSESEGAVCLIIKLDTPGGLLSSTRSIVKRILNSKIPVVVYVAPSGARAGSAGVFITLAAHVAAMAPSTNIGAAHPVLVGEGEDLFSRYRKRLEKETDKDKAAEKLEPENPMGQKIVNDTVAWITAITQTRGRNVEWAKKAVTESVSVPDTEAVKLNIVDFIANDTVDLLAKLNSREVKLKDKVVVLSTAGAEVVNLPMGFRQRLLAKIVDPNIAYLLMMFGILGLFFEFTHPGTIFPGVAGLICLLLALYAFQTLPVNYAAVALIIVGLALLVAEVKVVSHGLLAIGGIIALVIGSLMLIETPDLAIRVSLGVVLPLVLTLSAIILFIVQRVLRSRTYPVATGSQGLVGLTGEALTDLNPEGMVFMHGENWSAASLTPIPRGGLVRVIRIEGLRLTVEPVAQAEPIKQEKGEA